MKKSKGQNLFDRNRVLFFSPIIIYSIYFVSTFVNTLLVVSLILTWVLYSFIYTRVNFFGHNLSNESKIRIGMIFIMATFFMLYMSIFLGHNVLVFAATTGAGCGIYGGIGAWNLGGDCSITAGTCLDIDAGNVVLDNDDDLTITGTNSILLIDSGDSLTITGTGSVTITSGGCVKVQSIDCPQTC